MDYITTLPHPLAFIEFDPCGAPNPEESEVGAFIPLAPNLQGHVSLAELTAPLRSALYRALLLGLVTTSSPSPFRLTCGNRVSHSIFPCGFPELLPTPFINSPFINPVPSGSCWDSD